MWAELFKSTTSTFVIHIPYRGSGPALNDVLAGQVDVSFDQAVPSLPLIQPGELRALAVSWSGRLEVLPQLPTYAEANLFSNRYPSWFGLVAPSGMLLAIVNRLPEAESEWAVQAGGACPAAGARLVCVRQPARRLRAVNQKRN